VADAACHRRASKSKSKSNPKSQSQLHDGFALPPDLSVHIARLPQILPPCTPARTSETRHAPHCIFGHRTPTASVAVSLVLVADADQGSVWTGWRGHNPPLVPARLLYTPTQHPLVQRSLYLLEQHRCTPVSLALVRRGPSLWGITCPILIVIRTACVRVACALCHAAVAPTLATAPLCSHRSQPNVPGSGAILYILVMRLLKPSKRPSRNCVEERLDRAVTECLVLSAP
jgi:hypothetical protein